MLRLYLTRAASLHTNLINSSLLTQVAWLSAARILFKEITNIRSTGNPGRISQHVAREQARIQGDFDTVTAAMERLGSTCPLMGPSLFLHILQDLGDLTFFDSFPSDDA